MTTKTKTIAMLAFAVICILLLFPPRSRGPATSLIPVSRGFLLGDIYRCKIPHGFSQSENGVKKIVYAIGTCHIDVTRLTIELMVVLCAATTLALFLNLRSGKQPEKAENSESH